MKTPHEYLKEHPDHLIYENANRTYARVARLPGDQQGFIPISLGEYDWTGYSHPHILAGPEFQFSKREAIEWGEWRICKPHESIFCSRKDQSEVLETEDLKDGYRAFRFGKKVAASQPSDPEPPAEPFNSTIEKMIEDAIESHWIFEDKVTNPKCWGSILRFKSNAPSECLAFVIDLYPGGGVKRCYMKSRASEYPVSENLFNRLSERYVGRDEAQPSGPNPQTEHDASERCLELARGIEKLTRDKLSFCYTTHARPDGGTVLHPSLKINRSLTHDTVNWDSMLQFIYGMSLGVKKVFKPTTQKEN